MFFEFWTTPDAAQGLLPILLSGIAPGSAQKRKYIECQRSNPGRPCEAIILTAVLSLQSPTQVLFPALQVVLRLSPGIIPGCRTQKKALVTQY